MCAAHGHLQGLDKAGGELREGKAEIKKRDVEVKHTPQPCSRVTDAARG